MLKEVHVKLWRITKLGLGPEMGVAELRNKHARNNEHESKKRYPLVPVDFVQILAHALRFLSPDFYRPISNWFDIV